ncbi:MAG TPA: response regulator transcription factor [Bryobacteraceae bacterium]|jgi:DNA-binding response OmpR family regulator|nr:response regulator transcription factor [Bryobacteraceae bacterium]
MTVLVAEDKPQMALLLERALHREGHSVLLAGDGKQALDIGRSGQCDVILLDIMLPVMDGFAVIQTLRAERLTTPTIILSARDAMSDIVRGLDLGADDYMTKPFGLDVLLARIRAVTRRNPIAAPVDLRFEDLTLSSSRHELMRGNRVAPLTRTELALLEALMRRAGSIVPRDVLVSAGWGFDHDVSESTLYVFIRSLRNKIRQGDEPQLLQTVRGVGYGLRTARY